MSRLVQLLGVERNTETKLDTGAESLGVGKGSNGLRVDLGLDESRAIELVLGADLKSNTLDRVSRVVDGLGTNLAQGADLVVVRTREDSEVVGGSDSSAVGRSTVAKSKRVLGHGTRGDVVAKLSASEEAILAESSITSKGGALEKIKESTSVEVGLAEVKVELSAGGLLVRDVGGEELTLEARSKSVAQLNLGVKDVGGRPALGKSKTGGLVRVLALKGAGDGSVGGIGLALGSESNAIGGLGLDLKTGGSEVEVVTRKQVVGGLANVRESRSRHCGYGE